MVYSYLHFTGDISALNFPCVSNVFYIVQGNMSTANLELNKHPQESEQVMTAKYIMALFYITGFKERYLLSSI